MTHKFKHTLALVGLFLLPAGAARADTLTYAGNTFTDRDGRFSRPVENGSALDLTGTNAAYDVFGFAVTAAGPHGFLSTAQNTAFLNPFLILYSGAFNPATPLSNFVIANNNLPGGIVVGGINSQAGFTATLTVGTNYFLVTTGVTNFDADAFVNRISGPGQIVPSQVAPIPEPASLVLLGTGLASVAAAARRRRRTKSARQKASHGCDYNRQPSVILRLRGRIHPEGKSDRPRASVCSRRIIRTHAEARPKAALSVEGFRARV